MRIDRHVYGSISGYQTLACSEGVTAADAADLESLGIGQTADMSYLRSLAARPAWIVRTLRHRRVLTRITPGRPDDAGRPTVLRISILVSAADWDGTLHGDIGSLMDTEGLWHWDGQCSLAVLNATPAGAGLPSLSPETAGKLVSILSPIERSWASRRPVILREDCLTPEEFRILNMLIPPAARAG